MYTDLWCSAVNIDVDGFSKEHDHDCVKAGACNLAVCTVSISAGAKPPGLAPSCCFLIICVSIHARSMVLTAFVMQI